MGKKRYACFVSMYMIDNISLNNERNYRIEKPYTVRKNFFKLLLDQKNYWVRLRWGALPF